MRSNAVLFEHMVRARDKQELVLWFAGALVTPAKKKLNSSAALSRNAPMHLSPFDSYRRWTAYVAQLWRQAPCVVVETVAAVRLHQAGSAQQCNDSQLQWNRIFGQTPGPRSFVAIILNCWIVVRIVWIGFGWWYSQCGYCMTVDLLLLRLHVTRIFTEWVGSSAWLTFAERKKEWGGEWLKYN